MIAKTIVLNSENSKRGFENNECFRNRKAAANIIRMTDTGVPPSFMHTHANGIY